MAQSPEQFQSISVVYEELQQEVIQIERDLAATCINGPERRNLETEVEAAMAVVHRLAGMVPAVPGGSSKEAKAEQDRWRRRNFWKDPTAD